MSSSQGVATAAASSAFSLSKGHKCNHKQCIIKQAAPLIKCQNPCCERMIHFACYNHLVLNKHGLSHFDGAR